MKLPHNSETTSAVPTAALSWVEGFLFVGARRKDDLRLRVLTQTQALQRFVFDLIHRQFVERHGHIEGGQLAQAVVDKLFARPTVLKKSELAIATMYASDLAQRNPHIRDAALISLTHLLELERVRGNSSAVLRIEMTLQWLERFGEIPANARDAESLNRTFESLCGDLPSRSETAVPRAASRLPVPEAITA